VPRGDRDVLALRRWLGLRARNRRVSSGDSGPLWVAERTGDRLQGDAAI
jgi:hypothetical protein